MGDYGAGGLAGPLRTCLRQLASYEKTQNEIEKELESVLKQIADRRYLEGDYLQTLLLDPDLQTRCLSIYNSRILQQQSRLESLHARLDKALEGLLEAAQACRDFFLGATAAAADTSAAAAADAAFAADAAEIFETVVGVYTRQVALQRRLLLTLHELRCTDTKEMQRLLLLFKARPCEYPLRQSERVAAAEQSLHAYLKSRNT